MIADIPVKGARRLLLLAIRLIPLLSIAASLHICRGISLDYAAGARWCGSRIRVFNRGSHYWA